MDNDSQCVPHKEEVHSSVGGTFEDFLDEIGIREDVYEEAAKAVIAWQLSEAVKASGMTKTALASKVGTSRSQIERVLDPTNASVSLDALEKVARAIGGRLNVEFLPGVGHMEARQNDGRPSERARKRA